METVTNVITQNPESILAVLAFVYELIVRKAPTEKTYSILTLVGKILNGVIADKTKDGGKHI